MTTVGNNNPQKAKGGKGKEKPAKMVSGREFLVREAVRNGDTITSSWARPGAIYVDYEPVVHQMTLREMIDYMKQMHASFHPGVHDIDCTDEYWLSRTPLRLMYDAQHCMFYSKLSSWEGGQSKSEASETAEIKPEERSE